MLLRILTVLILLLSILFFPFWVSIILALVAMIYFSFFIEGVFLFLLSDLLFGLKEERFLNIFFVSFLISLIVLLIIEFLKKKIRLSK